MFTGYQHCSFWEQCGCEQNEIELEKLELKLHSENNRQNNNQKDLFVKDKKISVYFS